MVPVIAHIPKAFNQKKIEAAAAAAAAAALYLDTRKKVHMRGVKSNFDLVRTW